MDKIVIDNLDLSTFDANTFKKKLEAYNDYKLELVYKSEFSNTSTLRNLVGLLCDNLLMDKSLKFKIILIADELNNNAIEY
jgi:hypothetical protein